MPVTPSFGVPADDSPNGLTSDEARHRLEKAGPNSMPDTAVHPLRRALAKCWSPFPGCSKRRSFSNWCFAGLVVNRRSGDRLCIRPGFGERARTWSLEYYINYAGTTGISHLNINNGVFTPLLSAP